MTPKQRFMNNLLRNGQDVTVVTIAGTTCPCMSKRDSAYPVYNPAWHRDNPTAAACNGTGLISTTSTSTAAKAVIMSYQTVINSGMIKKEILDNIGEIQHDDLFLVGTVKTSDGSFIELSGMIETRDYITYNSKNYLIRHTFDYGTSSVIGHLAVLRRKA